MKFNVTAQAFDRFTGEEMGESRTEVVDTVENALFSGLTRIVQVKAAYEAFWNELNPNSEAVVFVSKVTF